MKGDCYTMKSLVLTAQDARELGNLGGLTITKPIKPAPPAYVEGARIVEHSPGEWLLEGPDGAYTAEECGNRYTPPVHPGDAVFIREPWYRLRGPEGNPTDRVTLAADAVVGEEQTAYKWASPVSMPEDAARRFARVVSVGTAYGPGVDPVWFVELEAVDKAAAVAIDAGLPYSTADDEEGRSDYFTYSGDMTPEDHEKMIAAIDADRARLATVQDRIVWMKRRRAKIASDLPKAETEQRTPETKTSRADALRIEDAALADELDELTVEEGNLRAALEDVGAPVQTVEERARERLEQITARRSEITALVSDSATTDDTAKALGEEDDRLSAEADELVAYLSTAETAPEDATPPAPEESATGDAPGREGTAAEADDEVGSFTLGKCKYCGREWGVTLEGAKGDGYPTQRTADAAATRVCDCEEATTNRAAIVGVALAVTRGACQYCGQLQEVGPHPSQAAADETASEVCNCPRARDKRRVRERAEDARERVGRLFGDSAEELGFKPVADAAVHLLECVVEMIARGPISSASLNIRGQCKAKFSVTSKGKIKVSRSETRSCDLEAGE